MTPYTASALFPTYSHAGNALSALHSLGIPNSALSVLVPERGSADVPEASGEASLRDLLGRGALGAGLGVAALALPGVGPLVAAGRFAAALLCARLLHAHLVVHTAEPSFLMQVIRIEKPEHDRNE